MILAAPNAPASEVELPLQDLLVILPSAQLPFATLFVCVSAVGAPGAAHNAGVDSLLPLRD